MMNRYRVIGAIALVWGAIVVISFFVRSDEIRGGAYGAGQYGGVILGGLLFVAGLYAVVKGGRPKKGS